MIYIGSSRLLHERRRKHWKHLMSGTHPNRYLQRAVDKYGLQHFSFSVVAYCQPDLLAQTEQQYIDELKAFGSGYNLLPNAYRNRGYKHTPEAIEKMRQAGMGRRFTAEHRAKIAAAVKAHRRSPEHALAISRAKKGKPSSFKGRHLSQEAKAKLRAAALQRQIPRNAKGQFYANH